MIPSVPTPAAAVAVVATYLLWTVVAAVDAPTAIELIAAVLFWLALMLLVAALVQRGVSRYRDRDRP